MLTRVVLFGKMLYADGKGDSFKMYIKIKIERLMFLVLISIRG
jgi:hypothetical protein